MKSEQEMDDELIAKYLSGEASPDEAIAMVDWLQLPANKIRFEQLEKTWNASAQQTRPTFNSKKAWSRIENSGSSADGNKKSIEATWWTTKTFRIAASVFLVVAVAVVLVRSFLGNEKNSLVATQHEIKSVTLPDSSKITLFRFSSIEYSQTFNTKTRDVEFAKGEAFFHVTHNTEKPFVIHTPTANIKVVGTEFNVKVVDDQTEVAVKEGKVMVYSSNDSIFLTTGLNVAVRGGSNAKVTKSPVNNNVWSYATGKLMFKETSLEMVIADLQRAYPCTISFANKEIGNCKLTATFEGDSVDKIINLIAETLTLKVKRNGEVYILAGEGCR